MKNYIKLGESTPGNWEHYVFLDTEDILADSLMNRHMVRREIEGVMKKDDEEYRLVSIKVCRKDENRFLQSMDELKGKMLLFGYRDYDSHGGEIIEAIRGMLKDEAKATGRIPLPAGGSVRADAFPEL